MNLDIWSLRVIPKTEVDTALFAVLFSFLLLVGLTFGGYGVLPGSGCDTFAPMRSIKSLDYAMNIAAEMLQKCCKYHMISHGSIMVL